MHGQEVNTLSVHDFEFSHCYYYYRVRVYIKQALIVQCIESSGAHVRYVTTTTAAPLLSIQAHIVRNIYIYIYLMS